MFLTPTLFSNLSWAQDATRPNPIPKVGPVKVGAPVTPAVVYIDMRALPKAPHDQYGKATEVKQLEEGGVVLPPGAIEQERLKNPKNVQRTIIGTQKPAGGARTPGVTPPQFLNPNPSFEGIGYTVLVPPDPNGAPGLNHYVQMVNSQFEIFDKQGNSLAGPTNINQLWASQPTDACFLNNNGDPIVLYDSLADRWLLSQFATPKSNPSHECIAISQTADPTAGTWYLYDFALPYEDDYPKLGVWPDGYYFSSQEGYNCCGIDAVVFDRANMLNGNPATFQTFHLSPPTVILLPGEVNGSLPPAGTPAPYARPIDGSIFGGSDRVEIWEFHVDWGNPAESTFTNTATLSTDPFSSALCTAGDLDDNCVPQPNTSTVLESQNVWPMGPLEYRNFGDHETLVFNHTVNATPATFPNGQAGVHWYEIRRTGGTWSIYQESTFAPDTTDRWMGSVAMDQAGDMAAGYSVSDATKLFPGIEYVGRLATDPLNEMTTPEVILQAGSGYQQANGTRWGDYSAMRVDPADGCTFWYTTQYINGNSVFGDNSSPWSTHVGAFSFPSCNPADLSITKTGPATVTAGNQITYNISVTNNGPSAATNVTVTDSLPQITFLNSSVFCTQSALTLTCNLGTLANGAATSFSITEQVPANELSSINASTTTITNTASVAADQADPNPSNNTASVTTTVNQSADVSVAKTCKPDGSATAGTTAFCNIAVSNAGPSDAQNVSLVDTLASNGSFTITSVVGPCSQTASQVTCNLGTVVAGGSMTITVNFTSSGNADVNDTATVSSSTPDPNTSNNSATGHVSFVASADLAIGKVGLPNPVIAGTNLTYTISVSNSGPSTATNVVVKDTIPAQVSVLTATPSAGSCTAGISGNPLQPLTCTLGALTPSGAGSTATITVVGVVASNVPDGTVVNNNATVSSDVADPNNANNSATAAVTVHANADLAIVKTSDKLIYKPSSVITYTIAVTNNGPSDALAVIVTDNLPTTMQAIYKSDTGGCTKSGLTLTCNLGTMPKGTSKSFIMLELVKGSKGLVSNTASVNSSTVDPNLSNNSSTRTVTIGH